MEKEEEAKSDFVRWLGPTEVSKRMHGIETLTCGFCWDFGVVAIGQPQLLCRKNVGSNFFLRASHIVGFAICSLKTL